MRENQLLQRFSAGILQKALDILDMWAYYSIATPSNLMVAVGCGLFGHGTMGESL